MNREKPERGATIEQIKNLDKLLALAEHKGLI